MLRHPAILLLLGFAFGLTAALAPGWSTAPALVERVPAWLAQPVPDSVRGNGLFVNVNTASPAELQGLPHIGPGRAASIVQQRARAPFGSFLELNRVGLSCHDLIELAPFATFAGHTDPYAR